MFECKKEEAGSVKSKADDKHAQVKVVSKRDSTILPNGGHFSGWINRPQERGGVKLSLSSKP